MIRGNVEKSFSPVGMEGVERWYCVKEESGGLYLSNPEIKKGVGFVLQYDTDIPQGEGWQKIFFNFLNPWEAFNRLLRTDEKDRCYYETIRGEYVKMHYDIDLKGNEWTVEKTDLIRDMVIDGTKKYLQVDLSKVAVMTSHGLKKVIDEKGVETRVKKFSYHIVFNGSKLTMNTCRWIYDQVIPEVCVKYLELFNTILPDNVIDKAVYSNGTQQFRLLGSTKRNEGREKIFRKEWSFKGQKVEYRFESDGNPYECFLESLVGNVTVKDIIVEHANAKVETVERISSTIPIVDENKIERMVNEKLGDQFEISNWKDQLVILKRKAHGFCIACKRDHDHENAFLGIRNNGQVHFYCYRDKSRSVNMGALSVERLTPEDEFGEFLFGDMKIRVDEKTRQHTELNKDREGRWIAKSDDLMSKLGERKEIKNSSLQQLKDDKRVELEEVETNVVPEYRHDRAIQVIRSPMDTQKTVKMKQYLREFLTNQINDAKSDDKMALFVAVRRSFAEDLSTRVREVMNDFKQFSFVNYLDQLNRDEDEIEVALIDADVVVISPESLHKVTKKYRLIVIDEVTSFCGQMDSGLHKLNLDENWDRLEFLFKNSQRILAMDADIDSRTIKLLKHYRREKINVLWNNYQRAKALGLKAIKCKEGTWKKRFDEALNAGKRLFVVFGSKAQGEKIEEYHLKDKGIKYEFIHGKTPGDKKKSWFTNINKKLREEQTQVFMCTSTLTVGVDINEKDYFDQCFVWGSSEGCHWRDLKQMVGRVRYLRDKQIVFTITQTNVRKPDSIQKLKQMFTHFANKREMMWDESMKVKREILNDLQRSQIQRKRDVYDKFGGLNFVVDFDSIRNWMSLRNLREKYESTNHLDELFTRSVVEQGYELIDEDSDFATNQRKQEEWKEAKDSYREAGARVEENLIRELNKVKVVGESIFNEMTFEEKILKGAQMMNQKKYTELQNKISDGRGSKEDQSMIQRMVVLNNFVEGKWDQITAEMMVNDLNRTLIEKLKRYQQFKDGAEFDMLERSVNKKWPEKGPVRMKAIRSAMNSLGLKGWGDTLDKKKLEMDQFKEKINAAWEDCRFDSKASKADRRLSVMLEWLGTKIERRSVSSEVKSHTLAPLRDVWIDLINYMKPYKPPNAYHLPNLQNEKKQDMNWLKGGFVANIEPDVSVLDALREPKARVISQEMRSRVLTAPCGVTIRINK